MTAHRNHGIGTVGLAIAAGASSLAVGVANAEPWSFASLADSQRGSDAGGIFQELLPGNDGVSDRVLTLVAQEIAAKNVDLVIFPGDLIEGAPNVFDSRSELEYWAQVFAPVIDAGTPIFPVRGNHEALGVFDSYSAWRDVFVLPDNGPSGRDELTYSFAFNNGFFAAIDIYTGSIGFGTPTAERPWLDGQLAPFIAANQAGTLDTHVFVFCHEPIHTRRGREPGLGTGSERDGFVDLLISAGVRYYMHGHDHQHSRSTVSLDAGSREYTLTQFLHAPAGEKFYGYDSAFEAGNLESNRQGNRPGYYITTVDGPHVYTEFFSAPRPVVNPSDVNEPIPGGMTFELTERFGYSLNGKQYFVSIGETYAGLSSQAPTGNGFVGSVASLLDGTNTTAHTVPGIDVVTDGDTVSFGWRTAAERAIEPCRLLASDVLELHGFENVFDTGVSDTYVLQISYDESALGATPEGALEPLFLDGTWGSAAAAVDGGTPSFVAGPYNGSLVPGTWGLDTNANVAWIVTNRTGSFAVGGDVITSGEFLTNFAAQDPSADLAAPTNVFDAFDVFNFFGNGEICE